jgi:23S rRNA (adenine-N6)-dimethyltransferase
MNHRNKRTRPVRLSQKRLPSTSPNDPGQHLLIDRRIANEMVRLARLRPSDLVIDIGAGKGALTLPLAQRAGQVWAVENDTTFAAILREKTEAFPHVRVICKNILDCTLPKQPFCVVASIPYAITTPILDKMLHPHSNLKRAVLLIEWGAAKRFTAEPSNRPNILRWRFLYDIKMMRAVSRTCFAPPPKVESAIIVIRPKPGRPRSPAISARFEALVRYALRAPDLAVSHALKGIFTAAQQKKLFRAAAIDRDAPVGMLTDEQWAFVFMTMIQYVERWRWP